jgi:DNA-binding transcriptional ArsR family regulator
MKSMLSLDDRLNATFSALSDPTRRAILTRLAQGRTHVGDLAQPFAMSGPAVSRHLRVLEQAGLIEREVDARWRVCQLQTRELQTAHDWLAQYRRFWEDGLDRLAELLEGGAPAPSLDGAPPSAAGPRGRPARAAPRSKADVQVRNRAPKPALTRAPNPNPNPNPNPTPRKKGPRR